MFVGIDYSITSPCLCIYNPKENVPDFDCCEFYFLTNNKKFVGETENIIGKLHDEYKNEYERYDRIASNIISNLPRPEEIANFLIEDYSFGSTGRVFNIAENCGHLKYLLWREGYKFDLVAPTKLKKFATGKGNASKELMYQSYLSKANPDLLRFYSHSGKLSNPTTDIVDAYFLALYAKEIKEF